MYTFDQEAYNQRMAWWTHDRFGMFIHFGLYAIPARGEWVRSTEELPEELYQPFFDEFNPTAFDARAWARCAREAGMNYVVLTAKHHDGFCLFDSALTNFKSTNTPFGRDLVAEYVEACRAEGLKVGLYFSLIDWHHPDFPQFGDRQAPLRHNPSATNEHRDWDRYLAFMHGQVRELCSNYGQIDLLWFDFSYDDMCNERWGATELMNMVRELQPQVVVNNRLEVSGEGFGSLAAGNPTPYHGDFITPEQMIPPTGLHDTHGAPLAWEACVTMNNNWGYCATDHNWKPADLLIHKLVECVSKGGNMILNVGPDATGRIPEPSIERLRAIGHWMERNHDSIWGCTGVEGGPLAHVTRPEYGRITRNGNTYYVHVYENAIGPLPLLGFPRDSIASIRRLNDRSEVPISTSWVHSDYPDITFANLGDNPVLPDVCDTVLAIRIKEGYALN